MEKSELLRFILKHRSMLLSYTLSLAGNHHLAEDIFQEVCVVLLEKEKEINFTTTEEFTAYIRRVARLKSFEVLRSRGKQAVISPEAAEALGSAFNELGGAEAWDERKEALAECIKRLPVASRKVLRLRYEDEIDCDGIGRALGRSRAAVHMMLSRIRLALAECIKTFISAPGGDM
ncbi:MAG TPA: sigma-70 family RNA polymerase sigma factor [Planctomycetes bacterium]|nr:sigma-70 family RNA polymerase sigma factor [Planctomycetota bacterium]